MSSRGDIAAVRVEMASGKVVLEVSFHSLQWAILRKTYMATDFNALLIHSSFVLYVFFGFLTRVLLSRQHLVALV